MGWGTDPVVEPPTKSTGGWGRDEMVGEATASAAPPSFGRGLADIALSGAIGRGVRGAVGQPYRLATHLLGTGEDADERLREWDARIRHGQQLTGHEGETDIAGTVGAAVAPLGVATKVGAGLRAAYPVAAKTLPGLLGLTSVEGAVGGAASPVPMATPRDAEAPGYWQQVGEQAAVGGILGAGLAGAGKLTQAGVRLVQPMVQGLTR